MCRLRRFEFHLVLEPIFEADFEPCPYGFHPNRRAHDAVAEIRLLASCSYESIVEDDIKPPATVWHLADPGSDPMALR